MRGPLASVFLRCHTVVKLEISVECPHLWSAEKPCLYNVVLLIRDKDGREIEYVSCKTGFRHICRMVQSSDIQILIVWYVHFLFEKSRDIFCVITNTCSYRTEGAIFGEVFFYVTQYLKKQSLTVIKILLEGR